LSSKLSSLVQAADDPVVLLYVINNLGRGVPEHACFGGAVNSLRQKAMQLLVSGQWQVNHARNNPREMLLVMRKKREMIEDQLLSILLEREERRLTAQLFQQSSLNLFLNKLEKETPDTLQKQLKSADALIRLLTVPAIGRRHLHLEGDLIELLSDPHPAVREAVRKSLIRVSRGTDFGPIRGTSQRGIARSVEKWRHWLALQQSESSESTRNHAVNIVLGHQERTLETALPDVTRLCDELVKARDDEQMAVLALLRDAKGIDNTDALALAIPKLSGAIQRETRDALAQRLTRMKAATLRDKMQEDRVEVRRAAALACGRKKAAEHIPDLLQLLDDPERAVIQAARKALKELTGEDLGPDEEAGRRGRASAAWRKWWKEQSDSRK